MISKITYTLCILVMCYASFVFYPRWRQPESNATIAWDVSGYYWYLPSVFIYKDLKHSAFKDSIFQKYHPTGTDFQQAIRVDNGNYVIKYSSGMAFMYLPFFTAAHLLSGTLGYPRDGFSAPYQFAIQLGGLLISLIGLWYLRKLLLKFYEDKVVAVTMLLLVIGSNYLNWAAIDTGMSHCWLFTIYVFLLLNTYYLYKSFKLKNAIAIGLLAGLAALTRPTDIIACLIPALWGIEHISVSAFKERLALIKKHFKKVVAAAVCAGAVIFIQFAYWKFVSGHWYIYSYGDQHFSWLHPHISDYTFSFRSGWLVYSPMLFLSFLGIIPFFKHGCNKVAILTFFLLNYYIVCAWDIWWFGGRAMIQSYPVLLFPMASLVKAMFDRQIVRLALVPVCVLFLYFNIWITIQYHKGGLYDTDCMTNRYFWRVVGRWHVPEETLVLRDGAYLYEKTPENMHLLYQNNFEQDTSTGAVTSNTIDGKKSLQLDKDHQNSGLYKFAYRKGQDKWLRAQAIFHCGGKEWDVWKMMQFIMKVSDNGQEVRNSMMRVDRLIDNGQTKTLYFDMKLPKNKAVDTIDVKFWNANSDQAITIDNLKVWGFS